MKEEGNNDDETNEEQNENENEDAETEDNDFVILDFVGKKGKDHEKKHFFLSQTKYDMQKDVIYVNIL